MDRQTSEAVVAYRKRLTTERKAMLADEELCKRVEGLDGEQFKAYYDATAAIDKALDAVGGDEAREVEFRAALNHSGRDAG